MASSTTTANGQHADLVPLLPARSPVSPSSPLPPPHIGILAIDMYFPRTYVSQTALEQHMNVAAGKFTIGLGQQQMAFVTDREDLYSFSLTAVSQFMSKYRVRYEDIGRLEVATETISDHSKAVKTVLMQLFAANGGNSDVEGIDCMNACYGGTAALFNSVDWIAANWNTDGRYAMVVAADIAEYAEGPARPTGGGGAVVMLIGPNAPLALTYSPTINDNSISHSSQSSSSSSSNSSSSSSSFSSSSSSFTSCRVTHMEHTYDFYKPHLASPYPVVDGKHSASCYLRSLDVTYERFTSKFNKLYGKQYDVSQSDYVLFHAPYNKLIQKALARLFYIDFLSHPERALYSGVQQFRSVDRATSYADTALEKAFVALSKHAYARLVQPSTLIPTSLGNLYTASLYAGLLSLLTTTVATQLAGKSLLMFSYGSGLAASLFHVYVPATAEAQQQLETIRRVTDIQSRLAARLERTPADLCKWMEIRERVFHSSDPITPSGEITDFFSGTYYLTRRDGDGKRFYEVSK